MKRCAFPRQDLLQVFPSLSALGPTQRRNYERFPPLVMVGQMSALGQKQTFSDVRRMSALPPEADIHQRDWHVRFVPIDEIATTHSIRSVAATRSLVGTVRPSAFAVFRFTTKSNLAGCSTGMSAGRSPLSILSTKYATRRYISRRFGP